MLQILLRRSHSEQNLLAILLRILITYDFHPSLSSELCKADPWSKPEVFMPTWRNGSDPHFGPRDLSGPAAMHPEAIAQSRPEAEFLNQYRRAVAEA